MLPHGAQTEMGRHMEARAEKVYKSAQREQLGKPMLLGTRLPPHVRDPAFAHGVKSVRSEAAKELIAPRSEVEAEEAKQLYKVRARRRLRCRVRRGLTALTLCPFCAVPAFSRRV